MLAIRAVNKKGIPLSCALVRAKSHRCKTRHRDSSAIRRNGPSALPGQVDRYAKDSGVARQQLGMEREGFFEPTRMPAVTIYITEA